MAKQTFKTAPSLGRKKALKKTAPVNVEKIERVVDEIHKEEPIKEPVVKVTIRIPKTQHRKLKMKLLELDKSAQEYFMEVVTKELT